MLWLVLLCVVVAAAVAALVWPFVFSPREPWEQGSPDALDRLLAEKARTLRGLKDHDHELEAGLLADAEYRETRAEYVERAALLNREIAKQTGVDPAAVLVEERVP